ncbi:MAG: type I-E CRISPR-associated protein Cse1/CasA [Oscillospiraceae bacterium]|nr:type I-E CRISPR-associated protein Cse1/CasA [Oscillospiraceae bacterium]
MKKEFNLIDEPWICVRTNDLTVKEVSLKDVFFNAHLYTELAGETKPQDFAVLRLLLAVMHTVFSRYDSNGDDTDDEIQDFAFENWINIWNSGYIPNKPIERYFREWYDRFWLFDENYPFYQSNTVHGKGNPYSTAKMIGSLFESGNKPRLFSDRYNNGRLLSYSEAARWLLHINCFDDIAAKKPTPKKTWTSKLSLIAVKGENLFETLMLNYHAVYDSNNEIYKSYPSWECDNNISEFNRLIAIPDNQAALLSLQSRRIYLCRGNSMVIGYYISGGDYFEEEDIKNEQMTMWKSYKEKKNDTVWKYKPKPYDTSKKAWQEFGSIAAFDGNPIGDNTESYRTPGIMSWINYLLNRSVLDSDYMVKISTLAVIYDYGQATSLPVIDMVSDGLTFHSQLLLEIGFAWRNRINDEIEKCNKAAMAVYILYKNLQKACGRTDKDSKTEQSGELSAKVQFYDMIDRPFRLWLAELKTDYDMDEYCAKLETELKRIALKFGNELAAQTGNMSIFGRYKKNSNKKEITSSAEALNIFALQIRKIFKQAGDNKNE